MSKPNPQPAEIEILSQGVFPWWTTSETGIQFKPGTPQDVWLEAVRELCGKFEASEKIHVRIMFMLGDALAYGETAFGEEYAQAIDGARARLRLSMKTIENAATICRNVPAENRLYVLTLSHFEQVQTLDAEGQRLMLGRAENEGLSVSALKSAVARHKLTEADKALLKTVTDKDPNDLSASEIKKLLKRARSGEAPKEKLVVDLNSEEGLQHAAEKVLGFFEAYDESEGAEPLKSWTKKRKDGWHALAGLAKIARRMGLSR